MAHKYENLMQEWDVTMDSPVLDKAFIAKVQDFKEKLEKKALTDEEAAQIDDEICKMFTELHNLKVEESDEVKKSNHRARIAEAKEEIALAETIDVLKVLQTKYDDLPELQPFIAKRIEKLEAADKDKQLQQFLSESREAIKAAKYEELPGLADKFKDYEELVSLINQRLEKEKPSTEPSIREKLSTAKKRRFSFDELRAMGVRPTGDDMEIEGVYLERQYLFKMYEITHIDGKKV